MALQFKKATKEQSKLRLALFGPSGAGKTYTALRIATGLGIPIAFIDTERGSASKYADRFDFDVLELEDKTIGGYVEAIKAAAQGGYPSLVIDSLSHGWQELLEEIDRLAKAKYKGNTWSAWSEGTPMQRRLVNAILDYPGHVLATMRSKTEWTTQEVNGRKQPVRVGLAPESGKGIEYEFDMLIEMSTEHIGAVLKDRTGKYQDKLIEKPDEDFGRELLAWLSTGEKPAPARITADQRLELVERVKQVTEPASFVAWLKDVHGIGGTGEITVDKLDEINAHLDEMAEAQKASAA